MEEEIYITLGDGTKINPLTGEVIKIKKQQQYVEVPTAREAQQIVISTRRKVSELPAPPKTMNTINVIISYTLFGLDDEEISIATGLTVDQIVNIKMQSAYEDMYNQMVNTIIEQDVKDVRQLFQKKSKSAAEVMINVIEDEDADMSIKMAAAKDILDRAGHRPADITIEHRQRMSADLKIEIIKKDETKVTPIIDITPIEVINHEAV